MSGTGETKCTKWGSGRPNKREKVVCQRLYRDLSPPQDLGSSWCTWREAGDLSRQSAGLQCDEESWSLCLHPDVCIYLFSWWTWNVKMPTALSSPTQTQICKILQNYFLGIYSCSFIHVISLNKCIYVLCLCRMKELQTFITQPGGVWWQINHVCACTVYASFSVNPQHNTVSVPCSQNNSIMK